MLICPLIIVIQRHRRLPAAQAPRLQGPVRSVPCGTGRLPAASRAGQRLVSRSGAARGWLSVARGTSGTPWRAPRLGVRADPRGPTPAPAGGGPTGTVQDGHTQPVEKAV